MNRSRRNEARDKARDKERVVLVTGSTFLNDIAIHPDGSIYISDTSPVGADTSRIYRFKDGKVDTRGNYLVSHWEGQIYSISASGEVTELMDAIGQFNTADFAYLKDKHLLIIPTFVDNHVVAYRLAE